MSGSQRRAGDFVAQDVRTDRGANLDDVGAAETVDRAGRQRIEPLRHVEPAVGRRSRQTVRR